MSKKRELILSLIREGHHAREVGRLEEKSESVFPSCAVSKSNSFVSGLDPVKGALFITKNSSDCTNSVKVNLHV